MKDQNFEKKLSEMKIPHSGLISREEEETAWKEIIMEIERQKRPTKWWLVAASIAVALMLGWWWYPSQDNSFATSHSEKLDIKLEDKSMVTLNHDSQLTVLDEFNENSRSVQLVGEAFFNIQKDPERPFIIYLDDKQVTVLGTSFSVNHQRTFTSVSVRTGRVELKGRAGVLILTSGQKGIILPDGELKRDTWNVNDFAWFSGSLHFENKTMKEVAKKLSELSDKPVIVSTKIANCRLNLKMDYERIEEVYEVIAETLGINWKDESKRIYFDGKGC